MFSCTQQLSQIFSSHLCFLHFSLLLFSAVSPLEVTLALLDAANDKDSEVQEQVRKSMLTLGKQQPDRVLAMCQDYLLKHPKVKPWKHPLLYVYSSRIKSIISLASDEMTRSKDVIPDWQQAASNILVAIGNKHINDIMEEILSKFQPGVLPHFFVVQTLANLSDSNVYGMVPFLNAILGTMLPMLNMAKQDNMKWVFSSALCHFSDSILEYLANLDKAPDPTVRKDTFSGEIYAAFDILFNNWLQSREPKLRLTVAEAVGSMCHLMANDKLEEQIPKLIPAFLSLYKKNNEHYIISKSLCQVIDASVNMGSRVLETQLESLLFALHQQVSAPIDYNNPPTVKNHNEVLRCFSLLANAFPDRLVMFVLQKLENSNERSRTGSLSVLRHLINSATSLMETKKLLILASIRQPMADHSNKVKKRVVQVISAMAHHGYLELEGGELMVRFIVQHCALPDTYQEVTNEALRTMCDNTLHLLTTTVGRLADVLWPKLLYYLTPSQYSNATTPLCKSLIVLGNKKKNNQETSFKIDFTQEGRWKIYRHFISAKCDNNLLLMVCVVFPFSSRGHGAPSLSLLQVLSVNIHPKTETVWDKEIPPLLSLLEGMEICGHNIFMHLIISFLYRCIGVTLQQSFNKEVVKKQLQEILLTARHNDAVEREGIAMGIGLCANSHLEGTLAKLDEFGKSDAFKKSPSIFNLLKERNDVEVEKVKSTLILCYGQVALNAPPEKILNRIDQDILRCISKHFNTKDLTMKVSLVQSVGLIAKAISECVKKQGFIFSRKQELIAVMLDFIKAEPADLLRTPIRHLVMNTCANMVSFHNLGALLGRLSPRCSDPRPAVRTSAIDCIYTLLYIQLRYEGFSLDYKDEGVDCLLLFKDRLENPDHSVLYKTCSDLTKRLPQQQLTTFVFMLFEGLVDSQPNCCRASSVILNTVLKNRGGGLQDLVTLRHLHSPLAMAKHAGPRLPAIVECLCPSLNNIYECQRVTVTAFFSELLSHHVVTELMLIDVLMNNMMERISDPCCTVRMLAVRGLGNIAVGSPEKVRTHKKTPTLVLLHLDKKNVHLLVYLCLGQTLTLFHSKMDFFLACLQACKYAMRVCAPVVGSEQITAMFQNHLHDDKSLHYGEFINDLTKYLIQDFPGMLNFYHISVIQFFKSNWPEVRAGAAMFIGTAAFELHIINLGS
uniref:Maestro heat-like repeat family member 1 n=1 Tax=Amphiprion ocellaris TaxID=80972 RepID=A0AAQ5Y5R6_AMPOC